MEAMRCKDCGDVRWSLEGFTAGGPERCELCGGEMVPERRLPTHRTPPLPIERRDAHPLPKPAARV